MTETGKRLEVNLVSPDGVLWNGGASFVVLPAADGELGIFPGHAPLLAMLGCGEMRVLDGERKLHFALFGGFLQVEGDSVQVIVDRAESPAEIDAGAAKESLEALSAPALRDYDRFDDYLDQRHQAQVRLKVAARKEKR